MNPKPKQSCSCPSLDGACRLFQQQVKLLLVSLLVARYGKKFQPMHKIYPCQDDDDAVKVNDKFTWLPKILMQLRSVEFFQDRSLRNGIFFPTAHPADGGKGLGMGRSCNKFILL